MGMTGAVTPVMRVVLGILLVGAMAVTVGAALAAAGAVMQAVFGNPLAEPGVVGVSSGAALGAAAAIVLGLAAYGDGLVAALAFCGGLLATLLVYLVSRANGRTEVVTLLLTGIAVNAFAGAGLAFLLFSASSANREQIVFWQLGSLGGSLWREVLVVVAVAVPGVIVAALLRVADAGWVAILGLAFAMGVVNAAIEGSDGTVVGVTYMTGTLVQMGQKIANALRGEGDRRWRHHLGLWAGLAGGAVLGARTVLWSAPLAYGLAIALAAGLGARAMWMARQAP